jgi:hypothetical protein
MDESKDVDPEPFAGPELAVLLVDVFNPVLRFNARSNSPFTRSWSSINLFLLSPMAESTPILFLDSKNVLSTLETSPSLAKLLSLSLSPTLFACAVKECNLERSPSLAKLRSAAFFSLTVFISIKNAAILSGAIPRVAIPAGPAGLIGFSLGGVLCLRAARTCVKTTSRFSDCFGTRKIVPGGGGGGGGGGAGARKLKSVLELEDSRSGCTGTPCRASYTPLRYRSHKHNVERTSSLSCLTSASNLLILVSESGSKLELADPNVLSYGFAGAFPLSTLVGLGVPLDFDGEIGC